HENVGGTSAWMYVFFGNFTAFPSITRSRSASVWLKNPTFRVPVGGAPAAAAGNTRTVGPDLGTAASGLAPDVVGGPSGGSVSGGRAPGSIGGFEDGPTGTGGAAGGISEPGPGGGAGDGTALGTAGAGGFGSVES